MKTVLTLILACSFTTSALCQSTAPATPPQPPASAQPPANPQNTRNRSVIKVKKGGQAIKNKDFYDQTGLLHPFRRMPRYFLYDQHAIWTSPFHTAKSDIKWWLIFGGATGALIASDKWTVRQFPNSNVQVTLGDDLSYIGESYTLIPIGAAFYLAGTKAGSQHFRETGLLMFESLIDTTAIETLIKSATDRARPLEGNGNGGFWDSTGSPYNASFPSGHAINTFGVASVFAHEYPHKWWVKVLVCGYAGAVVGARLAARKHFPGDVVAGGAIGWFTGDYVYAKRHNPDVDKHANVLEKILAHVGPGGLAQ